MAIIMEKQVNSLAYLVSALGIFAGGIALGVLLAPRSGKENRDYIKKSAGEAGHWVSDRSKSARDRAKYATENIRNSVKERVPDLYEATDGLHLTDNEVLSIREAE
jgi:gas vesicle protein